MTGLDLKGTLIVLKPDRGLSPRERARARASLRVAGGGGCRVVVGGGQGGAGVSGPDATHS